MTIDFTCQFSLTYYPFDKQLCSLVYNIEDAEQDVFIYKVSEGMLIDYLQHSSSWITKRRSFSVNNFKE